MEAFEDAKAAAIYDICRVVDTRFASITADYLLQLHDAAAAVGRSWSAVEFVSQIDQVAGEALLSAAAHKDIGSLFLADHQLALVLTAGAQRLQSLYGGLYVGELDHVRSTLCNPNLGLRDGCCVACALIRKVAHVVHVFPTIVGERRPILSEFVLGEMGLHATGVRSGNLAAQNYTAHMKKLYLV